MQWATGLEKWDAHLAQRYFTRAKPDPMRIRPLVISAFSFYFTYTDSLLHG
ncbi:hypothetical protein RGU75_08985 [Glaciimonas sp. CA11.2]|uniref:hypothetical protein n=1 Tax=Glaciimonas sp. CA11.2 TaxID=3048601 RepID=UPI002AB46967|nr:hypothetical protein [Glaciimonas sp. CA11.2]MDY7544814.1 hypothetical protein [Glaciimonas sp. CA11.2]MDY7546368.1 hypothetical protein [Glaciimonas sp. CA11.2]